MMQFQPQNIGLWLTVLLGMMVVGTNGRHHWQPYYPTRYEYVPYYRMNDYIVPDYSPDYKYYPFNNYKIPEQQTSRGNSAENTGDDYWLGMTGGVICHEKGSEQHHVNSVSNAIILNLDKGGCQVLDQIIEGVQVNPQALVDFAHKMMPK